MLISRTFRMCLIILSSCTVRREQQAWLVKHMETPHELPPQAKLAVLSHLVETDTFEHFLAGKFPGNKVP